MTELRVPKDPVKNLEYRLDMRRKANKDLGLRAAINTACREDLVYFFNSWAWLKEPRKRFRNGKLLPSTIPFITWPHQDEALRKIEPALGVQDITVVKSRDEGWSWTLCWTGVRDWRFHEGGAKIGLVSSTELKVDDPGNMGSLMAKIDWGLTKLPLWMIGRQGTNILKKDGDWFRSVSKHSFNHMWSGGQLNGFAGTPEAPRGDRYLWFGGDEHASDEWRKEQNDEKLMDATGAASDCRWTISTPNGPSGQFHQNVVTPSSALKLFIGWWQNPTKNQGLYRMIGNKPVAIDPVNNPLPPEYDPPSEATLNLFSRLRLRGYRLEGKDRSPWYDKECDRMGNTPQSMAKEFDLSFGGSVARIFQDEFMAVVNQTKQNPLMTGVFSIVDQEKLVGEFEPGETGTFKLWCPLFNDRPKRAKYCVMADVSTGLAGKYTSNSAVHVFNMETGEQALTYATNAVEPAPFADICMALGYWFWDAHLVWEHNHATAFTKRVDERNYPDVYLRKVEGKRGKQVRNRPGFMTNKETKEMMFSQMIVDVKSGKIIVRDADLVEEFGQYIRDAKNKIEHVNHVDDAAHGDRVMALGVGAMAMDDRKVIRRPPGQHDPDNPPPGTMAEREKEYQAELRREKDLWDDREPADMLGLRN